MTRGGPAVGSLALIASLAVAAASPAATLRVTRTGDPAPGDCRPRDCSLREAVLAANASVGVADRIVLPETRRDYRLTRPGTEEDSALDGDLDLNDGPVAIVHRGGGRSTISAAGLGERLFEVDVPATFRALVLTGGDAVGSSEHDGGAIEAKSDVTVSRSLLRGNRAQDFGGAIDHNVGTLRILRTKLLANRALDEAGAIESSGERLVIRRSTFRGNLSLDSQGGAMYTATDLEIRQSSFIGNRTELRGGAIHVDSGEAEIADSTFAGNRAAENGGAISSYSTNAAIWNSTFSGNRAAANGGGIWNGGNLALNGITVARNVSNADEDLVGGAGGGVQNSPAGTIEIGNSILALNDQRGGDADDCSGTFASAGGNLRGEAIDCGGFTGPGDAVRANPRIGRLARNGGPTQTIALKRGSAAIGRAVESFATFRDQRGVERDANPDSGAYER